MTTNETNTNNSSRPWENPPKKQFVVELSEKLVRRVRKADQKFWGWEPISISRLIERALITELERLNKAIKLLEDRDINDWIHSDIEKDRQKEEWALLLSIADGIVDRKALKAKHWSHLGEKAADVALENALKRLRATPNPWLEKGRSMVLTEAGSQIAQKLR